MLYEAHEYIYAEFIATSQANINLFFIYKLHPEHAHFVLNNMQFYEVVHTQYNPNSLCICIN